MDRSVMPAPADWQLPPGVSRAVWDYIHDSSLARRYDEGLCGTPLLEADLRFVDEYCPNPGRVLDLGCGTGRAAIPLARRGCEVVGVDLSESMLAVAGQKAAAAGVRVHWLRANIVELDGFRDQSFDVVLCLFSTLGMVADAESRGQVIQNAFRSLRPGGWFLLHAHNRWFHLSTAVGRRWVMKDIFRLMLRHPSAGDAPMPAHDGRAGWTMHLFTRREIVRLLRTVGFQVAEVRPASTHGRQFGPWFLPRLRAYGWLVAARRPG